MFILKFNFEKIILLKPRKESEISIIKKLFFKILFFKSNFLK